LISLCPLFHRLFRHHCIWKKGIEHTSLKWELQILHLVYWQLVQKLYSKGLLLFQGYSFSFQTQWKQVCTLNFQAQSLCLKFHKSFEIFELMYVPLQKLHWTNSTRLIQQADYCLLQVFIDIFQNLLLLIQYLSFLFIGS